jgi:hypothetical protein
MEGGREGPREEQESERMGMTESTRREQTFQTKKPGKECKIPKTKYPDIGENQTCIFFPFLSLLPSLRTPRSLLHLAHNTSLRSPSFSEESERLFVWHVT